MDLLIVVVNFSREWSLEINLGSVSRNRVLRGKGCGYSHVGFVSSSPRLTNVNSHFRLVIKLNFIAFKTFYLSATPRFMGVHSMLSELLSVTLVASEQFTSQLSPAGISAIFPSLSLFLKFPRFSCVINGYRPN